MFRLIRLALASLFLAAAPASAQTDTQQAGIDSLLDADRAFSAAAAGAADPVTGLAAIFDAEVVMPAPGRGHLIGREAVVAALREIPSWREGRVQWQPIRAGISADGMQGFTFGYLSLSAGDPARRNRKYLAYWLRRQGGWRVVVYRQHVREPGEVSLDMLPPSLPDFSAEPTEDAARLAAHRQSLAAAEQAFSDRAQQAGLRLAFQEYGLPDAMNMYEGAAFKIGLDAIIAQFPEGETTSPVRWSTEQSFVASTGDLGVSIGTLHRNGPIPEGQPATFPFFTIWRRTTPDSPWRYIAE